MNKKAYIITFNTPLSGTTNLHKAIDENHDIIAWWHYISNTYIVVSRLTANQIFHSLKPHIGNASLLVIEIDLDAQRQGWLPDKAWAWLRSKGV